MSEKEKIQNLLVDVAKLLRERGIERDYFKTDVDTGPLTIHEAMSLLSNGDRKLYLGTHERLCRYITHIKGRNQGWVSMWVRDEPNDKVICNHILTLASNIGRYA